MPYVIITFQRVIFCNLSHGLMTNVKLHERIIDVQKVNIDVTEMNTSSINLRKMSELIRKLWMIA